VRPETHNEKKFQSSLPESIDKLQEPLWQFLAKTAPAGGREKKE